MTKYSGNHRGNIKFTSDDDATELVSVTGYVYVSKGATFTAPALAEVSGSVDVGEGATFTAPALAEVSGYVYVREGATFTAPALAKSGYVYVSKGATFTAPALALDSEIFHEIADSGYVLFASQTRYKAGCRGPWDAATALAHWDRTDVRAVDFTAAIKAHEMSKQ